MGKDIAINGRGYRSTEFAEIPTPGSVRVITFGSSITFRGGFDAVTTYSAEAGRYLRAHDVDVEVLNLGVPAYSAALIFDSAEREAPRYQAAAVVIELGGSALYDRGDIAPVRETIAADRRLAISAFERYSFVATGLYPPTNLRATVERLVPWGPRRGPVGIRDTTYIESRIASLTALGREHGFDTYILLARPMRDFATDLDLQARERIAALAERTGAVIVDTYPLFAPGELADDYIVYPGDLHPNAKAHTRIGQELGRTLLLNTPRTESDRSHTMSLRLLRPWAHPTMPCVGAAI